MDALYFLKHSQFDDAEIRFSLRSIEQNLPWINKVWIFGDRPRFLSHDTNVIEHVPHEYVARALNCRTPVTNFFLLFFLSSLIPNLDHDFLWFCDDFIVLKPLTADDAKRARVVENLDAVPRGTGLWKESLWRTCDLLKRFGYTTWNFETHVPTFFTKTRVLEAYCDFRDFVTEDRWYGPLGPTAILNHANARERMSMLHLAEENSKVGFYRTPPPYHEVEAKCLGKTFLSLDDTAYGEAIERYLNERFPVPSKYEAQGSSPSFYAPFATTLAKPQAALPFAGTVRLGARTEMELASALNAKQLLGEGAKIGSLRGEFEETLLAIWEGACLHCLVPVFHEDGDASGNEADRLGQNGADVSFVVGDDRYRIHRSPPEGVFADGSLDFVYIDACHSSSLLEQTLRIWGRKVRIGGIIAGHEYLDELKPVGHAEVRKAVNCWAEKHALSVSRANKTMWLIDVV